MPSHPCPYLPGRMATLRVFQVGQMPGVLYHEFQNASFRRTGELVYQPICAGCRACVPLRVPVTDFAPSKSQRRCQRQNADLSIDVGIPELTEEKLDLYQRYVSTRHDKEEPADADSLGRTLYSSPVDTVEFTYRDPAGKLLGVAICDICEKSISSVYFYYDPDESSRGLGTFSALTEIDLARQRDIPYWYVGYWIKGCQSMEYKANFRPHELLHPDGIWRRGG